MTEERRSVDLFTGQRRSVPLAEPDVDDDGDDAAHQARHLHLRRCGRLDVGSESDDDPGLALSGNRC